MSERETNRNIYFFTMGHVSASMIRNSEKCNTMKIYTTYENGIDAVEKKVLETYYKYRHN